MKNLLLLLTITLCVGFNSIGQTASKNLENCQYVINTKPDGSILIHVSTFSTITLGDVQRNELKGIIYDKSRTTYKIEFNSNQQILIYHLSDTELEIFKEILANLNYYIDFVEQTTIENF